MIRKKNILYTALIFILTILLITGCGKNKKNIELGMTKQEVMNILGDPTTTDKGDWFWLGKAEKKYKELETLLERAFEKGDEAALIKADKVYKELGKMSFNFIYCSFSNDKLNEYFYDKNHKYDEDNYYISHGNKVIEDVVFNMNNRNFYIDERRNNNRVVFFEEISYTTTFTDGSIYKAYCNDYQSTGITRSGDNYDNYMISIRWSDYFSQKYEVEFGDYDYGIINCNKIGEIDNNGELISWTGDSNLIPNDIAGISDMFYYELPSEKLITFDKGYYYGNESNPYQMFVRPIDKSVESIMINENAERIIDCAFAECSNLKNITIPNSVKSIGNCAFALCSNLEKIILPNKLEIIESSLFQECSKLRSVTIPNSVKTIKGGAFSDCTNLISIVIPNSVENIDNYAFYNCSNLRSIFCLGNIDINIYESDRKPTIYYYSEIQPTDFGNYWHYDENNDIVVWD